MAQAKVLVVGQGEIGLPIAEILSAQYQVFAKDVETLDLDESVDVMHVCYPFQIEDFVGTTERYIAQYGPALTIIHSTVLPGTTRAVQLRSRKPIAYSPVMGKHHSMKTYLLSLTKFVGATTPEVTSSAMEHLKGAGMRVESFSTPEALELAKLVETTYFGLLIAWAQEIERYGRGLGADYYEIMGFIKEVGYLPPVIFQPGFIGGHCVMPNIELLERTRTSPFLQTIKQSNSQKEEEWHQEGRLLEERLTPLKEA